MIEISLDKEQGSGQFALPGSKYIANRLVILGALCPEPCVFDNVPNNDDINTAITGLTQLGAEFNLQDSILSCQGFHHQKPVAPAAIYTAHSGTFSRFVVALAALADDWISITGSDKMNSRPMKDLIEALVAAGVQIEATEHFTLPLRLKGPVKSDKIRISGEISSQYISALLLIGAKLPQGLTIELTSAPVSRPYLDLTIQLVERFGIKIEIHDDYRCFRIPAGQNYQAQSFSVPADPSSASYFLAFAAITGHPICLENFAPEMSVQGEANFYKVLAQMGCDIWQDKQGFHCQRTKPLIGLEVDMGDLPDVVQTLCVVAAFAEGETLIYNVENLAYKESNRIEDTATELRKTGLEVSTTDSSIRISPVADLQPATFDTYEDHRMAMSLGLLATGIKGIRMRNPEVVSKSFPTYWQYLERLGFQIKEITEG